MRTLFKNGILFDSVNGIWAPSDMLVEDNKIVMTAPSITEKADAVVDVKESFLIPSYIDGHIHIESTMMQPAALASVLIQHGTGGIVADPHEIANVAGTAGIEWMLEAGEGLPVDCWITLPSCVPATPFDESGARLTAKDLRPFYDHPRVVGLAEVMDSPAVLRKDADLMQKIADAKERGKVVNGHAPLLSGTDLDAYIAAGIEDDHECSTIEEALEKQSKGMKIMIRQGTAARNLEALLPLFAPEYAEGCMLVSDDKHPEEIWHCGHLDHTIRTAVSMGAPLETALQMATWYPARYFHLDSKGVLAPGYDADFQIVPDLETLMPETVYKKGKAVLQDGKVLPFEAPVIRDELTDTVRNTLHIKPVEASLFDVDCRGKTVRAMELIPGQLITNEKLYTPCCQSGVDLDQDMVKIAVLERHHNTGHSFTGFAAGSGLKEGAIASSIGHDSHNITVIGTNSQDMAEAVNLLIQSQGGIAVVKDEKPLAFLPLPVGGLMSDLNAETTGMLDEMLTEAIAQLGVKSPSELLMQVHFLSLCCIPSLKINTTSYVDVLEQKRKGLFSEESAS